MCNQRTTVQDLTLQQLTEEYDKKLYGIPVTQ